MLDQASLPWFRELNRSLQDTLDDSGYRARMIDNVNMLKDLAREIHARAVLDVPELKNHELAALLGPTSVSEEPSRLFERAA